MPELFQADIFSNPEPVFSTVRGQAQEVVRSAGRALFPGRLSELRSIEQFGGNEINSNNFKVRTDRETFLLKRLPAGADPATPARQLALMQWLADMGVAVARTVPSASGDLIMSHGGSNWCLLTFVEGNFLSGDEAGVLSTAAGLGTLQRTLDATPESLMPPKKWEYATDSDAAVFQTVCDHDHELTAIFEAKTGDALHAAWDRVVRVASELEGRRTEILDAQVSACHCDLHPHNILVHHGLLRAFIDFESFAMMPIDAAIGYGIFKLVRQHAVHDRLTERDGGRIHAVARRFVNLVGGHDEGRQRDMAMLRLMALAELFRRVIVIFRLNAIDGNRAWNHVLPMHLAGLAEIDVIFDR